MFHIKVLQLGLHSFPHVVGNVCYVALFLDTMEPLRAGDWVVEEGCEGWGFGSGTHV